MIKITMKTGKGRAPIVIREKGVSEAVAVARFVECFNKTWWATRPIVATSFAELELEVDAASDAEIGFVGLSIVRD